MQDWVQQLILTPLGLNQTSMPERDSIGIRPDPAATPHAGTSCTQEFQEIGMTNVTPGTDITELSQAIVQTGTGGSFRSTIRDLTMWAKSGTGDALLSNEMVQKRHLYNNVISPVQMYGITQYEFVNDSGDLNWYGLDGLLGWVGHDGDALGFGTTAYKNEILGGAAIATAANTCSFSLRSWLFVDAYNKELLSRQQEQELETNNSTAPPETTTPTITMTPVPAGTTNVSMMPTMAPVPATPTEPSPSTTSSAGEYLYSLDSRGTSCVLTVAMAVGWISLL